MAATSVTDLKARTEPKTKKDISKLPRDRQFPAMLDAFKSEIHRALPRHLNPERMARIALTEFRKTPKLAQCDPASVFAAIIQSSQLGLEPGLMGQAYLIPYKDQCQLIPGYQGLVDLVRRSGLVKRIEAHVVRDGDKFTYKTGMTTSLEHEPMLDGEPGDMRIAYAVAEFADGGFHVEVMTRRQIETIRDRSQNFQNAKRYGKQTPWDTDPEEMWRKTVIRRICKYLPKSAELATALAIDDAASMGNQSLSIDDAIDGTWAPVESVDDSQETSKMNHVNSEVIKEYSPHRVDAETGEIKTHSAGLDDLGYRDPLSPNPAVLDWRVHIGQIGTKSDISRTHTDIKSDGRLSAQEKADLTDELRARQAAI